MSVSTELGVSPEVEALLALYGRCRTPHGEEETMTASQGEATRTEQHAAPPEAWDAIAEGYDRYVAPQEVDLANEALRLVGLERGERFLDVAAGTGGLSLPAARLGAQVVATDWAPAMIERFEARVRAEGLSNAEGRLMDCHALDLPDDSFDVTGSQFGVMLVPDQPRALREMVRVTKPGGRVLVIAYGSPAELEFLQFFGSALKAVAPEFPGLPDDPPPLEFQLSDPDVVRERLTNAGLRNVRVERTDERPTFASGQEMWDWVLYGNPIPGMLVADLGEDQRARLRQILDGMLRERAEANGRAVLTNPVNIATGRK
jgi:ubiquinone/menaquinone biosynthesis C-methylase UbiE